MPTEFFGHEQELMISTLTRETAYGTPPAVSSSSFQRMSGYNMNPENNDTVIDDSEEIHGSEIATTQEITEFSENLPLEFPKVTPNALAAFGMLAMGAEAITQDEALTAYKHYITMVGENTALPSVGAYLKQADQQRKYVGIKAGNLDISSEENGHVAMNVGLMSSGQITESSETMQAAVAEVLMRAADTKVYLNPTPNPATDIIAAANLAQDTDNISSGQSLTGLGSRVKSWSFGLNNNISDQRGHGGQGFSQDLNFGSRELTVEMALRFNDKTEYDYYTAQTYMALEFNNRRVGAGVIAATGAYYWGFILRIPKLQLKVKPVSTGGVKDPLEVTLTGTILDDGTNQFFDLTVYNAIAAYLD